MLVGYYHIYGRSQDPHCAELINYLNNTGFEYVFTLTDFSPEYEHSITKRCKRDYTPIITSVTIAGEEDIIGGFEEAMEHIKSMTKS
tara:strand:- start:1138 stop:1398 length:261 start_codon:yes stop_codon:yes gene_type:complete